MMFWWTQMHKHFVMGIVIIGLLVSCNQGTSTDASNPTLVRSASIKKVKSIPKPTDANWNHTWGNLGVDFGVDVVTDEEENVYTLCASHNKLDKSLTQGFTLLKYSKDGKLIWSKAYTTKEKYQVTPISIKYRNPYLLIGGNVSNYSEKETGIGIFKLNTDGKLLMESNIVFDSSPSKIYDKYNASFKDMLIDNKGNCIFCGTGNKQKIEQKENEMFSNTDVFFTSISSEGKVNWAKGYGANKEDYLWDFALDKQNNIYGAGETRSIGSDNYATLIKISEKGELIYDTVWTPDTGVQNDIPYSQDQNNSSGFAIALDNNNNIYMLIENYSYSSNYSSGSLTALVKITQKGKNLKLSWQRSLSIKALSMFGSKLSVEGSFIKLIPNKDNTVLLTYSLNTGHGDGMRRPYGSFTPTTVIRISNQGNLMEQYCWSGSGGGDWSTSSYLASNGILYFVGSAWSNSGKWLELPAAERITASNAKGSLKNINDIAEQNYKKATEMINQSYSNNLSEAPLIEKVLMTFNNIHSTTNNLNGEMIDVTATLDYDPTKDPKMIELKAKQEKGEFNPFNEEPTQEENISTLKFNPYLFNTEGKFSETPVEDVELKHGLVWVKQTKYPVYQYNMSFKLIDNNLYSIIGDTVACFNDNGEERWHLRWGQESESTEFSGIVKTKDNNLLLSGGSRAFNSLHINYQKPKDNIQYSDAVLLTITNDGKPISAQTIGTDKHETSIHSLIDPNGDSYIVGQGNFEKLNYVGVIQKITKDGKIQWQKLIKDGREDTLLQYNPITNLIYLAWEQMDQIHYAQMTTEGKIQLSKSITIKEFDKSYSDFIIKNSLLDQTGNLYLIGSFRLHYDKKQAGIIKIDPNGQVLWAKSWFKVLNDEFQFAVEDKSSNIITLGTSETISGKQSDLLLCKYSPEGTLLFSRVYRSENSLTLIAKGLVKSRNNNLLIAYQGSTTGKWFSTIGSETVYTAISKDCTLAIQNINLPSYQFDASKYIQSDRKLPPDFKGDLFIMSYNPEREK